MIYKPVIGLEVHVELKTRTKMFCGCLNDFSEEHPNINVCPVCTGQPGTLPSINKQAVEAVLKVGMALSGEIAFISKFDRKNYFYPDLPKAYQISQYDLPLVAGGVLNGVKLRRIHLEEDTARLLHESPSTGSGQSASLIDFNRAGVPLMELVTEPDIENAAQAVEFAKELQLILRYLGVSDADMEKGQMRVEANISLGRMVDGNLQMGTKVEVKNLNSFRVVGDAINYEIKRQEQVLDKGEKVRQETRGWDDVKKSTVSQRLKEEAFDYRYFPEPDLPPLDLSKFELSRIKKEIPELPKEKRFRFGKEYGLTPEQAEILVESREEGSYFEHAVSELAEEIKESPKERTQLLFNYFTTDLRAIMVAKGESVKELKITPENFAELINLIFSGKLSSRSAKDILAKMYETGADPSNIMEQENLTQVSDESSLMPIAEKIVAANPQAVADYKKGKSNSLQFLIGKAMAELRGRGNPGILKAMFEKLLSQ